MDECGEDVVSGYGQALGEKLTISGPEDYVARERRVLGKPSLLQSLIVRSTPGLIRGTADAKKKRTSSSRDVRVQVSACQKGLSPRPGPLKWLCCIMLCRHAAIISAIDRSRKRQRKD